MDFEEIEFSDWQIEKLRSGLHRYRAIHKRGKALPSWSLVRDDITNSDSNMDKYDTVELSLDFKFEALRRFAERINKTLGIERLRDVARFLFDEGLLSPETFEEERQDLATFLALQEFFANDYEDVQGLVSAFTGTFIYRVPCAPDAPEIVTITLHLTPDNAGQYVRVEEIVRSELVEKRAQNRARYPHRRSWDNEFIHTTYRRGYGLPITPLRVLHIFLDGVSAGDRMTYIQAGELHGEFVTNGFFLMRNGEATGRDQWARDIYYEEPVVLPNVCRFIPDQAQEL